LAIVEPGEETKNKEEDYPDYLNFKVPAENPYNFIGW